MAESRCNWQIILNPEDESNIVNTPCERRPAKKVRDDYSEGETVTHPHVDPRSRIPIAKEISAAPPLLTTPSYKHVPGTSNTPTVAAASCATGPSARQTSTVSTTAVVPTETPRAVARQASTTSVSSLATTEVITLDDSDEGSDDEATKARELLNKKMGMWKSPIYAFFTTPSIETSNGRPVQVFTCIADGCRNVGIGCRGREVCRFSDTKDAGSTSTLKSHAEKCFGKETVKEALLGRSLEKSRATIKVVGHLEAQSLTEVFRRISSNGRPSYSTNPLSTMQSRAWHVRWVSENKWPFSIVKDRSYQTLMRTGRPATFIPTPEMLSRDVRHVYNIAHEGALHITTDAWTSPNNRAFVAFTVHYETKGRRESMILDFVELAKSHTGANLAAVALEVLEWFGVKEKFHSLVANNASNNKVMVEELETAIPTFKGALWCIPCFLHVSNLVAQAVLKWFDSPAKASNDGDGTDDVSDLLDSLEGSDDEFEEDVEDVEGDEAGDDNDNAEDLTELDALFTQAQLDEFDEVDFKPVRSVLGKLRKFAIAVKKSSTGLLPEWKALLPMLGFKTVKVMQRDVKTRWNSTYDMLKFAHDHRTAIDMMTGMKKNNLRRFEMSDEEWAIVEQLRDVLKVMKEATVVFSSRKSTVAQVIPAMDAIDYALATTIKSADYHIAIRSAAHVGLKLLNKYYSRTDASECYRIAMVLDLKYKMSYFMREKWPHEWIAAAQALAQQVYNDEYASKDMHACSAPPSRAGTTDQPRSQPPPLMAHASTNPLKRKFDEGGFIASLSDLPAEEEVNELEWYLTDPVERLPPGADLLQWWYNRRSEYPRLSRMALDYLTIPSTSVDVERVFSQGHLVLSHVCSRLSAVSMCALLCLGDWSSKGLVRDHDIKAKLTRDDLQDPDLDENQTAAEITHPSVENEMDVPF